MLDWFRALMPKEDKFYALFDRHAVTVRAGSEALADLLTGRGTIAGGCQTIARHEDEADGITREVMLAVRRTFITPFDRSDISDLTTALDDAIDQMQKTGKAIQLFEVGRFEPGMVEMGQLIKDAAKVVEEAVPLLRALGPNQARLNALTERVIQLEGRADDIHNEGLKAMFAQASGGNDPMAFIVGSQIYDHLEKTMDRLEDVANRISGILVDHL